MNLKLPTSSYVFALLFGAIGAGVKALPAGVPATSADWINAGVTFLVAAVAFLVSAWLHYSLPSPLQQQITAELSAIVRAIVDAHQAVRAANVAKAPANTPTAPPNPPSVATPTPTAVPDFLKQPNPGTGK